MKKTLALVAAATTLALVPAAAQAQTPELEPVICAGTLQNQMVGEVTVPYDSDCTLRNVVVLGSVYAETDARSLTLDGAYVTGDVTTDIGNAFTARYTYVRGNVRVIDAQEDLTVTRSVIGGNARFSGTVGTTQLTENLFRGDLLVQNTNGGAAARNVVNGGFSLLRNGAFSVTRNLVRGTLDCAGNDPAPTVSANSAGQTLGQCAA